MVYTQKDFVELDFAQKIQPKLPKLYSKDGRFLGEFIIQPGQNTNSVFLLIDTIVSNHYWNVSLAFPTTPLTVDNFKSILQPYLLTQLEYLIMDLDVETSDDDSDVKVTKTRWTKKDYIRMEVDESKNKEIIIGSSMVRLYFKQNQTKQNFFFTEYFEHRNYLERGESCIAEDLGLVKVIKKKFSSSDDFYLELHSIKQAVVYCNPKLAEEKGKKVITVFNSFDNKPEGIWISEAEYNQLPDGDGDTETSKSPPIEHTHTHTHTPIGMTKLVLHLRPDMKAESEPQEIKPSNWNELGEFTVTRKLDDTRASKRRVFLKIVEEETKYGKIEQFVFDWDIVADKSVIEKIDSGIKIKIKVVAREDLSNRSSQNLIKVGGGGFVAFTSATIKSLEITIVGEKGGLIDEKEEKGWQNFGQFEITSASAVSQKNSVCKIIPKEINFSSVFDVRDKAKITELKISAELASEEELKKAKTIEIKARTDKISDLLQNAKRGGTWNITGKFNYKITLDKKQNQEIGWENFKDHLVDNFIEWEEWTDSVHGDPRKEMRLKVGKKSEYKNLAEIVGKGKGSNITPFMKSLGATIGKDDKRGDWVWEAKDNNKFNRFPTFDKNKKFGDYFMENDKIWGEKKEGSNMFKGNQELPQGTYKEWKRIFDEWMGFIQISEFITILPYWGKMAFAKRNSEEIVIIFGFSDIEKDSIEEFQKQYYLKYSGCFIDLKKIPFVKIVNTPADFKNCLVTWDGKPVENEKKTLSIATQTR